MKIAAWNLNHRVGKTRFVPKAAVAVASLDVDVLVLTEYFPQTRHEAFGADLRDRGFTCQLISVDQGIKANRVLIAAKDDFESDPLPTFPPVDRHVLANALLVHFARTGLRLLGIRVPWYSGKERLLTVEAWAWLESTMREMESDRAVVIGDLNVTLESSTERGGDHFRRLLANGWSRSEPVGGGSFVGDGDAAATEIDHALCSRSLKFSSAHYQRTANGWLFAGGYGAMSDHAVLVVDVAEG